MALYLTTDSGAENAKPVCEQCHSVMHNDFADFCSASCYDAWFNETSALAAFHSILSAVPE